MSTAEVNKIETEMENKSPDKKQIEAEEKEQMLKADEEKPVESPADEPGAGGPVKTALSTEFTEQGREVKPKFIPIGGIKMPGFFTRNSDKDKTKTEDETEKDGDNTTDEPKPRRRLQFLHTCLFTQFLHRPQSDTENPGNTEPMRRRIQLPKIELPKNITKIFQRKPEKDPEAALASMETLDDKEKEAPADGLEDVKLEKDETDGKVITKMPLIERIRQKKFIVDDVVVAVLAALVLLAVIVGVCVGAAAGPPAERPLRLGRYMTTLTTCGPVEGILDEGVYKFFGIPYAVPATGERRFAYAQPLHNLSLCWNDTLRAHAPTPLCLQFLANGSIVGDEDCLTLDVVTPHVRYDAPLSVVVLIGANTLTGGVGPLQPSAMYARTKEVVFVRPNFRLGSFGFLSLDVLSGAKYPRTSGNYGLGDLLAVLGWVKHNIKHFGGDPAAVTLFGHRAGATLAAALSTVRAAQRLHARAWLSSPAAVFPRRDLAATERTNEQFKLITKCGDVQCLRRISAAEILAATPDLWLGDDSGLLPATDDDYEPHSWLTLDGELLRADVAAEWRRMKEAKTLKPLVFGTAEHAGHTHTLRMKHLNWTAEIVERFVNDSVVGDKNLTRQVFQHVNKTYAGLAKLISSIRTVCPLVGLARGQLDAPMYVALGAGAGGGAGGSAMADADADVKAILGTFDSDTAEQRRYMGALQQQFYHFVYTGRLAGVTGLAGVAQDALPMAPPPLCALLEQAKIVPQYAHVD